MWENRPPPGASSAGHHVALYLYYLTGHSHQPYFNKATENQRKGGAAQVHPVNEEKQDYLHLLCFFLCIILLSWRAHWWLPGGEGKYLCRCFLMYWKSESPVISFCDHGLAVFPERQTEWLLLRWCPYTGQICIWNVLEGRLGQRLCWVLCLVPGPMLCTLLTLSYLIHIALL